MAKKPPKKKQPAKSHKTKLTANQKQWNKEVKRIRAALKRIVKQGYTVPSPFTEALQKTIERPARVTKEKLKELKQVTPTTIRESSWWVDEQTGEVIPGQTHFKEEQKRKRDERKRKPEEQDEDDTGYTSIINTIENMINNTPDTVYWRDERRYHSLVGPKSVLLDILRSRVSVAEANGTLKDYALYLADNMEVIQQQLHLFEYNYSYAFEQGRSNLRMILSNHIQSISEQREMEDELEYLKQFHGDDYGEYYE